MQFAGLKDVLRERQPGERRPPVPQRLVGPAERRERPRAARERGPVVRYEPQRRPVPAERLFRFAPLPRQVPEPRERGRLLGVGLRERRRVEGGRVGVLAPAPVAEGLRGPGAHRGARVELFQGLHGLLGRRVVPEAVVRVHQDRVGGPPFRVGLADLLAPFLRRLPVAARPRERPQRQLCVQIAARGGPFGEGAPQRPFGPRVVPRVPAAHPALRVRRAELGPGRVVAGVGAQPLLPVGDQRGQVGQRGLRARVRRDRRPFRGAGRGRRPLVEELGDVHQRRRREHRAHSGRQDRPRHVLRLHGAHCAPARTCTKSTRSARPGGFTPMAPGATLDAWTIF